MTKTKSKPNEKLIVATFVAIVAIFILFLFTSNQSEHPLIGTWHGVPNEEFAGGGWYAQFAFDSDGNGAMMALSAETGFIFHWVDFFWTSERSTPNLVRTENIDPANPDNRVIQYLEFEISADAYGNETLIMSEVGAEHPLYVLTRLE